MKKSLKIFAIVMMALVMIFTATNFVFAASAVEVINGITPDDSNINTTGIQQIDGSCRK